MKNLIKYTDLDKYRFERKDIDEFYVIDGIDFYVSHLEMYSGGIEIFTNIIYNDEDYIILIFLDHQNNIHFMNHQVEGFNDWKDLKVLISSDQIDSIKKTMEKLVKKVLPLDFWKVRSSLN